MEVAKRGELGAARTGRAGACVCGAPLGPNVLCPRPDRPPATPAHPSPPTHPCLWPAAYQKSLLKAFQRAVQEGRYPFIIGERE